MSDKLIDDLLTATPDGEVRDVRIGAFWTAVVVETDEGRRCGLASNLHRRGHCHQRGTGVARAGHLLERSTRGVAALARSESLLEASVGVATINAILPRDENAYVDANAGDVIAQHGAGKRVVVVGSFPFVPRLREQVESLTVLDEQPGDGLLPPSAAGDVIPAADVLAITGAALVNHTLEGLLALRRTDALVLVLGPSTPLSPVLYEHGADILSGSIVEEIDPVVRTVSQGGGFRQIRRLGVRLVTMRKAG
jgi:uncharacterized protein (DUF4213/DUF364 family)